MPRLSGPISRAILEGRSSGGVDGSRNSWKCLRQLLLPLIEGNKLFRYVLLPRQFSRCLPALPLRSIQLRLEVADLSLQVKDFCSDGFCTHQGRSLDANFRC